MSSALISGFIALLGMFVLSAFGVPIGISVAAVAAIGMYFTSGLPFMEVMFQTIPYSTTTQYAFIVVPMFVLMGNIAWRAGIIEELFDSASMWMSKSRGAMYYAITLASAGFSSVSGSTVANAAVFTRIVLPEMLRLKYDKNFTAGCIAASGTFAVLIPPSLGFVLFGIMTGESVGQLFVAGVIPGIITAIVYMIAIRFIVIRRPALAPKPEKNFSLQEKVSSLKKLWGILLLVALVLGGIYTGKVPPSAAGAVGAVGALLIALLKRRMAVRTFWNCVAESAITTASIFLIVISGFIFARFLVGTGFITELTALMSASGIEKWEFLTMIIIIYLVLGMFIDGASMAVITLPFIYPIAKDLGVDGIWFGVLFVKLVEIGAITPPIGINLFTVVAASRGHVSMINISKGIWPFIVLEMVVFGILLAFPVLSTWLPSTMY